MDLSTLAQCTRINVVGTAGSGKSTFARQLGEILDLRYVEMDALFWRPDWQETPDLELFAKVRDATAGERWVIDGNYTRTIPEKWRRVEAVVWLDLSLVRTVYRVTKRCLDRSLTQREIWPGTGNRETLRKSFLSSDSVIWWAITSHRANRQKYLECMQRPDYAHIRFFRLMSPAEVAACLASMDRAAKDSKRDFSTTPSATR